MDDLALVLGQSLELATARQAEQHLRSAESNPGFSILLLHVVAASQYPTGVRLAGAVFFKNLIRRKWTDEDGKYLLPEPDVVSLKSEIVGLMISLPANLQAQLGEAVSIMADSDFPDRWSALLPELTQKLGVDSKTNIGVLTVAHSIFGRWRPLFRSDALFLEIKLVLSQFCKPYQALFVQTDASLEASGYAKEYLETMQLLAELYFDLNCQDLPEFFEDSMTEFMALFHKYLLMPSSSDDDEPGPLEQLKATIFGVLELYSQKYDDVFGKLLPLFVNTTLQLLSASRHTPRDELVVSRGLAFLTSVAKMPWHSELFAADEVISQIVEKIVVPNMQLRQVDEELFEDEPVEYTRRDLEGSDSDTSRRAATDFIRGLNDQLEAKVTKVSTAYVQAFLEKYNANPDQHWRDKDTATYLFSAIATKGNVTNAGVSSTNLLVDVVGYFSSTIAPDLSSENCHPILKVDAIKFIYTFRNQLTKDQLAEAFKLLASMLGSTNQSIVHTYVAVTLERILAIRVNNAPMFSQQDISDSAQALLANLFRLVISQSPTPEKLAENEFLMKCVMRVLSTAQTSVSAYAETMLHQLVTIVNEISKNPSNPKFSHYTFESIATVLRYGSLSPEKTEPVIIPVFLHNILGNDIQDFVPYVFQILAMILTASPADSGLSDTYKPLVHPLMSPRLWEVRGNVPALVPLLRSLLRVGGAQILELVQIEALLGIFQRLIASRVNDSYAFDLLEALAFCLPAETLRAKFQPHLAEIGRLILNRLQSSSTDKFEVRLARFVYFLAAAQNRPALGPQFATAVLDSTQDGVFGQVLARFILPATLKINGALDRKVAAVGMTQLLFHHPEFSQGKYNDRWVLVCETLIKLLRTPIAESTRDPSAHMSDLLDEHAFSAGFSKLSASEIKAENPAPAVSDPQQFMVSEMRKVPTEYLQPLLDRLDPDSRSYLLTI